jgi:UDP-N-acetylglucosamine acyltransferase
MAYSHIAHDCRIGNRTVFANHATVAGHVTVEDCAVFGGMAAVGAFLRVGESAMLAASAMVERDVVPFCTVAGDRAKLRTLNRVGLVRRGFDDRTKKQIKSIFRALKDHSRKVPDIVRSFREAFDPLSPEALRMLDFMASASRGLVR